MKVDLPEGNWASLRDPKQVPERLRRPVVRALTHGIADSDSVEQLDATGLDTPEAAANALRHFKPEFLELMADLNDLLVVALVEEWSFDVPVTVEAALDLPAAQYDALQQHVAPLLKELLPDFGPDSDPKARTGN